MSDQDNIIPFRDPRRRAIEAASKRQEQDAVDPILEAFKRAPRNRDWYPVFARNLGEMARRLDQDKPHEAARKMFCEAFGETADANWRKRKRYLRFEGEEASFASHGEYVSNNEPYRLLSDAFAKLHFAGDKDGPRKAHRMLVRGTSLNPQPTVDASQTDGLSQVLEWMKDLQAKCAADPDIASALSCLNRFPIAPFCADELEAPMGARNLAATHRGKGLSIVPAPTSTIAECADEEPLNCWHVGRILLGYLYFPQEISSVALRLPAGEFLAKIEAAMEVYSEPKAWEAYALWKKTGDEFAQDEFLELRGREKTNQEKAAIDCLKELISERLEEAKIEDFWIGDEYYESSPIPWSLRRDIYIRKPVYLIVAPNGADPELKLDIAGEWFSFYPERRGDRYDVANPEVFTLGSTPADDELIIAREGVETFNELRGVRAEFEIVDANELGEWEWGLRLVDSDNSTHIVGGDSMRKYPTTSYSASVDDDEMRDALLEGAERKYAFFKPTIWDDLGRLSAAPHGSIAASILRNLAFAPDEKRIDALLMEDARNRLQGVVEFVRSELEKTNASLGVRGMECGFT